jgi:hypothetical protein
MPLFRNYVVGSKRGLPRELEGLKNFTFFNGHVFGETTNRIFWDVCHVRGWSGGFGGYYIIAGVGIEGTSAKKVLIMKENGPVQYFQPGDGGSAAPFTGACATPDYGSEGHKAVFLGSASGTVTKLDMTLGNMLDSASAAWFQNGSWSANTPISSWPHTVHTNLAPGGDWIAMGKAAAAPGSTKHMSRKARSLDNTTAWTTITVPDVGADEGYVKGRVSNAGYIMALAGIGASPAQTFAADISDSAAPVSAMSDSGLGGGLADLDYSPNADKFVVVSGDDLVRIINAGWAPGGPVTVASHTIPNLPNSVGAQHCVAMDVGSHFAPGESEIRATTWYGFMVAPQGLLTGPFHNAFYLTKDFVNWFSIDLPGGNMGETIIGQPFPSHPVLKFCHNRLFVFTAMGVAVSGPLGEFTFNR